MCYATIQKKTKPKTQKVKHLCMIIHIQIWNIFEKYHEQ